ncbi:steroid delta-isomerase [Elstera litoralis]|uniref:Steroid delta-isomerase n=1 Tax=Elstera litoralis TaxID=552518 RepID=A0A0F3IUR1_9PROT|nr:nuclear transport factor 2 family protein [Elstera litoralis]KJV09334.1 steroid delta-isomerase [Elstera litoralis]
MHSEHTGSGAIEYPVQKQLEAYNARDIDAFMEWWAEDCQCFLFPSQLIAQGTLEIRARYVARFEEPNLHAEILARMIVGNLVIDHEHITRTFPNGPGEIDTIAMYEIDDGKIVKAWFKMGEPRLHSR